MVFSFLPQLLTGVQHSVQRHNQAFMALEGRLLNKHQRIKRDKSSYWFGTGVPVVAKGMMFAIREGQVFASVTSVASEGRRKMAQVLNGAVYLNGLHYTIDGRDWHFFVKLGLPDGDLRSLGISGGHRTLENGLNVTISERSRRGVTVEFHTAVLTFSVRYGLVAELLEKERARVMEQAQQRALAQAWVREQQQVLDGRDASRTWTESEKQQLLALGKVPGYEGYYVLPVEQYPELADSRANIQFLKQNEMGKR